MGRDVQLAHNRRVEGGTQAQVLLNLGGENKLYPDRLRRLVALINRYLGKPVAGQDVREAVGDALTVADARPLGAVWLFDGLWRQSASTPRSARSWVAAGSPPMSSGCCSRWSPTAVDPRSKLAATEWASHDAAIPGLESMDEDQACRAMDLLIEADAQSEV